MRPGKLDSGIDTRSPVSNEYPRGKRGFPFSGIIERVKVEFLDEAAQRSLAERFEEMLAMD
jgi:hypothetical protein